MAFDRRDGSYPSGEAARSRNRRPCTSPQNACSAGSAACGQGCPRHRPYSNDTNNATTRQGRKFWLRHKSRRNPLHNRVPCLRLVSMHAAYRDKTWLRGAAMAPIHNQDQLTQGRRDAGKRRHEHRRDLPHSRLPAFLLSFVPPSASLRLCVSPSWLRPKATLGTSSFQVSNQSGDASDLGRSISEAGWTPGYLKYRLNW